MKLILTQKRSLLVDHLLTHPTLRRYLRSSNRLTDTSLIDGVSVESFATAMIGSVDPQRMVATALISEDDALANVAAAWAVEPDRIPIGPSRAARTNSSPKQTSRGRHPQTPEDKAMPPSGIEPNPTLPEDLEEPDEDETGEPEAEVTEVTKEEVDWSSERAQLLRRITKLESEIDRLQASLPITFGKAAPESTAR